MCLESFRMLLFSPQGFPGSSDGKESACTAGDPGSILGQEDLEKGMATHSRILAWRIPWTEQPAAAAAKSFHSCPTLCDPINGSPLGSSVPGILQARILEWVAISFSNA